MGEFADGFFIFSIIATICLFIVSISLIWWALRIVLKDMKRIYCYIYSNKLGNEKKQNYYQLLGRFKNEKRNDDDTYTLYFARRSVNKKETIEIKSYYSFVDYIYPRFCKAHVLIYNKFIDVYVYEREQSINNEKTKTEYMMNVFLPNRLPIFYFKDNAENEITLNKLLELLISAHEENIDIDKIDNIKNSFRLNRIEYRDIQNKHEIYENLQLITACLLEKEKMLHLSRLVNKSLNEELYQLKSERETFELEKMEQRNKLSQGLIKQLKDRDLNLRAILESTLKGVVNGSDIGNIANDIQEKIKEITTDKELLNEIKILKENNDLILKEIRKLQIQEEMIEINSDIDGM